MASVDLVTWLQAVLDEDERDRLAFEYGTVEAVLADIAAKRALIALHPMVAGRCEGCGIETEHPEGCLTIRTLATGYSYRLGYREDWRP